MEQLKFDWSPSDYLNSDDLNRVEKWTKYLSDRLPEYGYFPMCVFRESNWSDSEIPSASDMDRIRKNVVALRDGYFSIPEWREITFQAFHSAEQQNAMEWDLQMCYNWIEIMIQVFLRCGTYNSNSTLYYLTDEMHFWTVIPYPTLTGKYVYNQKPQIPVLKDGENTERSGDTSPTDAGLYTLVVKPKHGYKWETGVRTPRRYKYEILKAEAKIEAVSDYTMGRENFDIKIPIKYTGDGELSVSVDSPSVLVVDATKDFLHLVSQDYGVVNLLISAKSGKNYLAVSHNIKITVEEFARTSVPCGISDSGDSRIYPVSN